MFAPRILPRIISSSSSSLLRFRSIPSSSSSSSSRCFSSLRSSIPSASHLRRSFSTSTSSSSYLDFPIVHEPISNEQVSLLLSNSEELPPYMSASEYQSLLQKLKDDKAHIPEIFRQQTFLLPNREDPNVNNAILELYSEAFESNWSTAKREEVGAYLAQEYQKGGDAALVIAINQLLQQRVTISSIIKSLGGWYPFAGMAVVIAVSKEILVVNEELLLVTNFLAVFAGIYFQIADSVLEGYNTARDAIIKKYYDQRELEIDANKALLAVYEKNPKVGALLVELKEEVNRLINERSRAKYVKKKAEIHRQCIKALDTIVATEAQAEGKLRRQILDRFTDYMNFTLSLHRVRHDKFFSNGMLSAVSQFLTGVSAKPENTAIGGLVKEYITNALWTVDWKNLKLGPGGLRWLGIYSDIKLAKVISALVDAQNADAEAYFKQNPKATKEDYFKARGVTGVKSVVEILKDEIKKNPQKIQALVDKILKERAAWKQELSQIMAQEKASRTSQPSTKVVKKETISEAEKENFKKTVQKKFEALEALRGKKDIRLSFTPLPPR